jgi:glucosylceramidase
MKGTQIFTDKEHCLQGREIFPSLQMPGAQTLRFSDTPNRGFMGFGVAITGSSCYLLAQMEPAERRALLEQLYGKNGLGLGVARISIGASDYSAELYSYDDVPFDTDLTHFSIDRDRRYIIPMIKEILAVNPDLYIFASPWSPPGWMKTGGAMCGGYMREQFVACYADYIIKFIKAYAAEGINVRAITPQNEPNTQQKGKMPACIWHPEIEARFINVLRQKLTEQGMNTEIWMFDHNFADVDRVQWSLDNCTGLSKACNAVAFHYYEGSIEQTAPLRAAYPKLALHFTEGGPRLYDNYATDHCKWGLMASRVLGNGFCSMTGWNLMLDECGGPNIGPFFCGGLVTRDSRTGVISYSGQYRAFAHIAPYLKPGADVYSLLADTADGMFGYPKQKPAVEGARIDNHDGKQVLVLVNPDADKKQVQLCLDGTWWYVELLGNSVSTVIIG